MQGHIVTTLHCIIVLSYVSPHQIRRFSVVQSSKLFKLTIWPLVNFFKNTWSILVMSDEVPTETYCLRFLLPCPLFLPFAPCGAIDSELEVARCSIRARSNAVNIYTKLEL